MIPDNLLDAIPIKPLNFGGYPLNQEVQQPSVLGGILSKYPWIGSKYDKDSTSYWIWFGDATGSFVGTPADYIEKMNLSIGTEDTTAYFNLLLGDDSPSDDIMFWSHNSNSFRLSVYDYPQVELKDSSDNSIKMNIETGPLAHFADDSGNFIKIDLTGSPEIEIFDTDGNVGTTILDGNSLSLTDGVSGNTLAVDVGVPSLEIVVDTDTTTLGDGDLHMSSPDGSVSIGAESENGKIVVGDSKLSDGDIDLGATGSVTINSIVYEPTQIMDCNGAKLWILADTTGWTT